MDDRGGEDLKVGFHRLAGDLLGALEASGTPGERGGEVGGREIERGDEKVAFEDLELALAPALVKALEVLGERGGNQVAVTLPASFAENWFSGHISEFYKRNAEVDLRLDGSNRMVDLYSENFDFAIRYCAPPDERHDETWLFGDFVLPVCSKEFAKRYGLPNDRKSLRGLPLIHLHGRTPDPQWADWEMWIERFGFECDQPMTGVHFSQFSSGLQAALAGQGLVLCGVTEAFNALTEGQLIIPFGPELNCPTGYQYRLVSLRGRSLTKLQRGFKSWVIETAEEFRHSIDRLLNSGSP